MVVVNVMVTCYRITEVHISLLKFGVLKICYIKFA